MSLKNKMKTNKFKIAVMSIGLILVSAVVTALCFGFSKLNTTKTISASAYDIGIIDATTGKYVASEKSIYMEEMQSIDGLTIEVEEDAQVTYKVAYYNEDKVFISMTDALSEDLATDTIPESASYFRVIITPNAVDGEDVELSVFNASSYAKQITVTYEK